MILIWVPLRRICSIYYNTMYFYTGIHIFCIGVHILAFCVSTLCSFVGWRRFFGRVCCFRLQDELTVSKWLLKRQGFQENGQLESREGDRGRGGEEQSLVRTSKNRETIRLGNHDTEWPFSEPQGRKKVLHNVCGNIGTTQYQI